MKTTPELAQALTNLRPNADFEVVLEFFARVREEARDECESVADDTVRLRAQGRGLFIRDFFKLSADAPLDTQKFKQTSKT